MIDRVFVLVRIRHTHTCVNGLVRGQTARHNNMICKEAFGPTRSRHVSKHGQNARQQRTAKSNSSAAGDRQAYRNAESVILHTADDGSAVCRDT